MANATIAARGAPLDFDRWAAMGNKGWAWPTSCHCSSPS
jgi:hypothetical protein